MLENAMTTEYELVELFNKPGLFTNGRIDRTTVPKGWFCYDLRGSDDDPGEPARLEKSVTVNHAGTVVMPEAIIFPKGNDSLDIQGELNFLGESINLAEFCRIHGRPANSHANEYTDKRVQEMDQSRQEGPDMTMGGIS